MNMMNLVQQHPLLYVDLQNLGLATTTIHALADQMSIQLGGDTQFNSDLNLCYTLAEMDKRQFVQAVDVAALAKNANVSTSLAQAAIFTLAPWVDRFRLIQQVG